MTTAPAISVIIPLYNAEKYIGECLESLLAQTFQDFEVIIVDDCSTDSSLAVVESYASKFNGRLTLSSTEKNSGTGVAGRNKGLILSRGKYVFNMDNDDLITLTALEELFTLAENFDADVVYCEKYYTANSDLSKIYIHSEQHGGSFVDKPTLESENLAQRVQKILQHDFWVTPWSKLVRRDLLIEHEIFFPSVKIADDDIWTYELIFRAKKILRVPNVVYVWRHSEDSLFRRNRTPQSEINFWSNPLILGLKKFDDFMGETEFFQRNPQYRLAILDHLVHGRCFAQLSKIGVEISPLEFYETIRDSFAKNLGEYNVLVAYLCTLITEQRKDLKLKDEQIQLLLNRIENQ